MLATLRRDQRGETLVEVLVTVVILGLAGTAIMGAVALSARASDLNRKQATAGSYVRGVVETVQNYVAAGGYQTCGAAGVYATYLNNNPALVDLPPGYTLTQPAKVDTWDGTTSTWSTCASAASDYGVQRVRFQLLKAGTDGRPDSVESLYVILRKPCSGSVPTPC
ncbi:type II secretion system protein [Nocardioides marmoriginsengisoli]|uniref:Type II secretion system protein n=1 Tax=Nocardioides marmoriginsengisoli TaxID=661483 RepID=A0A3N0CG13_9ACTN|nr:prepilin-type N-terminal cleavage/methylation domain-containing protein [Nocardioides marmoriginsengisoli]RNL62394.1 type II secretion system protein [Nocardioides marmoriginsengisoli]